MPDIPDMDPEDAKRLIADMLAALYDAIRFGADPMVTLDGPGVSLYIHYCNGRDQLYAHRDVPGTTRSDHAQTDG
jgi:hypothetical protein